MGLRYPTTYNDPTNMFVDQVNRASEEQQARLAQQGQYQAQAAAAPWQALGNFGQGVGQGISNYVDERNRQKQLGMQQQQLESNLQTAGLEQESMRQRNAEEQARWNYMNGGQAPQQSAPYQNQAEESYNPANQNMMQGVAAPRGYQSAMPIGQSPVGPRPTQQSPNQQMWAAQAQMPGLQAEEARTGIAAGKQNIAAQGQTMGYTKFDRDVELATNTFKGIMGNVNKPYSPDDIQAVKDKLKSQGVDGKAIDLAQSNANYAINGPAGRALRQADIGYKGAADYVGKVKTTAQAISDIDGYAQLLKTADSGWGANLHKDSTEQQQTSEAMAATFDSIPGMKPYADALRQDSLQRAQGVFKGDPFSRYKIAQQGINILTQNLGKSLDTAQSLAGQFQNDPDFRPVLQGAKAVLAKHKYGVGAGKFTVYDKYPQLDQEDLKMTNEMIPRQNFESPQQVNTQGQQSPALKVYPRPQGQ